MTHLLRSLLNRNLLALVAFAAVLTPQALKANEALCPLGNATPHGTYVLTVDGTGIIVGVGGLTAVGEITYDGNGHEHAQYTASVNGTIYKEVAVTGVYTVNSDCTGSLTESDGSHYNMVIAPDGSTVYWIRTDSGFVISGTEVRLRHLFD
jgi:hypothetical protein